MDKIIETFIRQLGMGIFLGKKNHQDNGIQVNAAIMREVAKMRFELETWGAYQPTGNFLAKK